MAWDERPLPSRRRQPCLIYFQDSPRGFYRDKVIISVRITPRLWDKRLNISLPPPPIPLDIAQSTQAKIRKCLLVFLVLRRMMALFIASGVHYLCKRALPPPVVDRMRFVRLHSERCCRLENGVDVQSLYRWSLEASTFSYGCAW